MVLQNENVPTIFHKYLHAIYVWTRQYRQVWQIHCKSPGGFGLIGGFVSRFVMTFTVHPLNTNGSKARALHGHREAGSRSRARRQTV